MTRTWTRVLGTAAVLGLVSAPVSAQGPGKGRGGFGFGGLGNGPGGPRLERVARALDLSEEQQAAFEQLAQQHRTEVAPLIEDARKLHEGMRAALDDGSADPTAIGEKMISAHGLMAKVRESRADLEARFEGLRTPEQRETLKTLKSARERMRGGEGRRGRHGRRGGRGPGGPPATGDSQN